MGSYIDFQLSLERNIDAVRVNSNFENQFVDQRGDTESATLKVLFMQICELNRYSFKVFEHNKRNVKVLTHQVFFAGRRAVLVFGWNLNLDFRNTTLKPLSELLLSESV